MATPDVFIVADFVFKLFRFASPFEIATIYKKFYRMISDNF